MTLLLPAEAVAPTAAPTAKPDHPDGVRSSSTATADTTTATTTAAPAVVVADADVADVAVVAVPHTAADIAVTADAVVAVVVAAVVAVVAVPDEGHVRGRGPTDQQRALRRVELRGSRVTPQAQGHACRSPAVALDLVPSEIRPCRVVVLGLFLLLVGGRGRLDVVGAVCGDEDIVLSCF